GAGAACAPPAVAALPPTTLRDIAPAAAAATRTLATRLARSRSRALLAASSLAPSLFPPLAVITGAAPVPVLLTLVLLPATTGPMRASVETTGPALVEALKRTAAIEVGFALIWTLGLAL